MPTDRYTKAVLTLIAACLVYLCLAVTRWPVVSAQGAQEVVIVGWKENGQLVRALPTRPGYGAAPLPVSD